MILIACLAWYDEQPVHLTRCIRGAAAAGATHVVAVDGAYAHYPATRAISPPGQQSAIRTVCRDLGLSLTLHAPTSAWHTEMQKRTLLLALGHAHAEPYEDWLLVVDADEDYTHAEGLRDTLRTTPHDVASPLLIEQDAQGTVTNRIHVRKAFRTHPQGIRVHAAHYLYVRGDGELVWQGGNNGTVPTRDLPEHVVMHRATERTARRLKDRNDYYDARHANATESNPVF